MGIFRRAINLWKWSSWPPKDYFEWTGWVQPEIREKATNLQVSGLQQKAQFLMPNRTEEIFKGKTDSTLDDVIDF